VDATTSGLYKVVFLVALDPSPASAYMIFLPLAPLLGSLQVLASARVIGLALQLQLTARRVSRPRTTEASDGAYRRESFWPLTPRRLAALCGPELRLGSGSERTTGRAAGRTRAAGNGRDDGARRGAEQRPGVWSGGARVQAPEPRRPGPSTSLIR
jgi:hypothetical protein